MTIAEKIVILLNAGYDLAEIPRELEHQHARDTICGAIRRIREDLTGTIQRARAGEAQCR